MNIASIILTIILLHILPVEIAFSQTRAERAKQRNNRDKDDGAPKAGEMAPIFTVKSLDGTSEFALENFRQQKPVILFFGSYT